MLIICPLLFRTYISSIYNTLQKADVALQLVGISYLKIPSDNFPVRKQENPMLGTAATTVGPKFECRRGKCFEHLAGLFITQHVARELLYCNLFSHPYWGISFRNFSMQPICNANVGHSNYKSSYNRYAKFSSLSTFKVCGSFGGCLRAFSL